MIDLILFGDIIRASKEFNGAFYFADKQQPATEAPEFLRQDSVNRGGLFFGDKMKSTRRVSISSMSLADGCWYCGEPYVENGIMQWDHILPRHLGGKDLYDNLVPSCQRCNAEKGKRTVNEYRDYLRSIGRPCDFENPSPREVIGQMQYSKVDESKRFICDSGEVVNIKHTREIYILRMCHRLKKNVVSKVNWGGVRSAGLGKSLGKPTKPAAEKLVYKRVGLLPAEWERCQQLARREKISVNAALRRILNDSD